MFDLMPFERRNNLLSRYFDNFDKEFFGDFMKEFKTDVLDKGDKFVLEAELPGFKKEDIHIDVEDNRLTIRAEHSESKEEKGDGRNYIRRERSYGSYSRSFDISNVRAGEISAEYNNGVLEVSLPKREETKPAVRKIDIQ